MTEWIEEALLAALLITRNYSGAKAKLRKWLIQFRNWRQSRS